MKILNDTIISRKDEEVKIAFDIVLEESDSVILSPRDIVEDVTTSLFDTHEPFKIEGYLFMQETYGGGCLPDKLLYSINSIKDFVKDADTDTFENFENGGYTLGYTRLDDTEWADEYDYDAVVAYSLYIYLEKAELPRRSGRFTNLTDERQRKEFYNLFLLALINYLN